MSQIHIARPPVWSPILNNTVWTPVFHTLRVYHSLQSVTDSLLHVFFLPYLTSPPLPADRSPYARLCRGSDVPAYQDALEDGGDACGDPASGMAASEIARRRRRELRDSQHGGDTSVLDDLATAEEDYDEPEEVLVGLVAYSCVPSRQGVVEHLHVLFHLSRSDDLLRVNTTLLQYSTLAPKHNAHHIDNKSGRELNRQTGSCTLSRLHCAQPPVLTAKLRSHLVTLCMQLFNDAGIPIEPFHFRKEREEGYFDEDGNYIEHRLDNANDAWLDSLQVTGVVHRS